MLSSLIVYVEDDPDDVFFLRRALEQAKHSGEFVNLRSASEAQRYLAHPERVPALILVDLHIGPDSGKELITYIRTLDHLQKVPVVTLSGSYVYEDLDKAYETGANLFLVKPADVKGWTDTIFKLRDYFPPPR